MQPSSFAYRLHGHSRRSCILAQVICLFCMSCSEVYRCRKMRQHHSVLHWQSCFGHVFLGLQQTSHCDCLSMCLAWFGSQRHGLRHASCSSKQKAPAGSSHALIDPCKRMLIYCAVSRNTSHAVFRKLRTATFLRLAIPTPTHTYVQSDVL